MLGVQVFAAHYKRLPLKEESLLGIFVLVNLEFEYCSIKTSILLQNL